VGRGSTFRGGVHPPQAKDLTNARAISILPPPEKLVVLLSQHIGAPAECVVKKGDEVKMGQKLATAAGFVSVPIHSPVSGKILSVGVFPGPAGSMAEGIEVENDGEDIWESPPEEKPDYQGLEGPDIIEAVRDAGIVGLGGAAFPTHVKLSPPKEKKIDSVILNGAECEPYLTADHRLMLERPREIVQGLELVMKAVAARWGYIGIELNKRDAIRLFEKETSGQRNITVIPLQVKYPQGEERSIIKAVLDREVPLGGLPMDVGVIVQNVGTAFAVYEAVAYGKPLIERVLTVSGRSVRKPGNLLVRLGTRSSVCFEACGGWKEDPAKVIMGGPMMGLALYSTDVPVVKGTSGLLALSKAEAGVWRDGPCISCGRCVDDCPMRLTPCVLATLAENERWSDADEWHVMDCKECGVCTFACPAKRPLMHLLRLAKAQVLARRRRREAA
jgi:electron transport complex protein RnfC